MAVVNVYKNVVKFGHISEILERTDNRYSRTIAVRHTPAEGEVIDCDIIIPNKRVTYLNFADYDKR